MKTLFETNRSKVTIEKFKLKVEPLIPGTDFEKQRNNLICLVLGSMTNSPKEWDDSCQININWIGDTFINILSDEQAELSKSYLDDICSFCFRFLFELYLSVKNELVIEFDRAKNFVFKNIAEFTPHSKEQLEFAIREMPIAIFKNITKSEAIENLKDFNQLQRKAVELKNTWDQELENKEKKVLAIKDSLDKYEKAFNFVGLHQGFDELSTAKTKEKNRTKHLLFTLAIFALCPVIFELYLINKHLTNLEEVREGLIFSIIPTFSLVAISIYYFRVLLVNYKSLKSQILQIELRKTLCRFIQNYADYSTEIKKKDGSSLEKFENVIFSGIVSSEENLPSTYDGIEQIGNLIKSIKS